MGNALPTLPQCAFHMCFHTCAFHNMESESQWCSAALAKSPPRDGYCLLSLTLPRTRIRGGCSCNVRTWSSNEAHHEGEGGVQYKEASKVNSALAAVKFVRTLMVQSRFLEKINNRQRRSRSQSQSLRKNGYKINEAPKPQKINQSESTKHQSLRRFEFKTVSLHVSNHYDR